MRTTEAAPPHRPAPDTAADAPATLRLDGIVERPVAFPCAGETLLGVLSTPEAAPARQGVVIVVGGPQVRSGSHRGFTSLARRLSRDGLAVLRFDVRGMGDSSGTPRSFEQLDDDIGAAIEALGALQPGLQRIALWGLCDGASAALLYLRSRADPRVRDLCLLNPWVRSEQSLARTHLRHYYVRRVLQPAFWSKLVRGGIGATAVRSLWRSLRLAKGERADGAGAAAERTFQERMAAGWQRFDGRVLLLLSENDATAQEFSGHAADDPAWRRALASRPPVRVVLPGADHTCATPGSQQALEAATSGFLREAAP